MIFQCQSLGVCVPIAYRGLMYSVHLYSGRKLRGSQQDMLDDIACIGRFFLYLYKTESISCSQPSIPKERWPVHGSAAKKEKRREEEIGERPKIKIQSLSFEHLKIHLYPCPIEA